MDQLHLFNLAPEVLSLQAVYELGEGWRLRVVMRRQGQPWEAAHTADYSSLTTSELADVLLCEISTSLAL